MPGILCRIARPLHGTQRQPADQRLLRRAVHPVEKLLDLFRAHFIADMNMIAEIIDECA